MPSCPFSHFHARLFQTLWAFDHNYQLLRLGSSPFGHWHCFCLTCSEPEFLRVPNPFANDWQMCKNESPASLLGADANSEECYTPELPSIGTPMARNYALVWFFPLLSDSHRYLTSFSPFLPGSPFLPCLWILAQDNPCLGICFWGSQYKQKRNTKLLHEPGFQWVRVHDKQILHTRYSSHLLSNHHD